MRRSYFSFFLLCLWAVTAWAQAPSAQKMLTLDEIFGPDPARRVNFSGTGVNVRWLADGQNYLQARPNPTTRRVEILKVNAASGETAAFYETDKMVAALVKTGVPEKDASQVLGSPPLLNAAQNALLLNYQGDVWLAELNGNSAKRITNTKEEELEADFSPDGQKISYVRGNNLFVYDVGQGKEKQLTTDGSAKFLNGYLDWIYEEELYGRGNKRGYWWSPDSNSIAYLRIDETPVPQFVVVDHIPTRQVIEDTPYPKAGDPNPLVKLGVADIKNGKSTWADIAAYKPEDFLISRVAWTPDSSRVVFQAQDRAQTFLDLTAADRKNGKATTLFRETTPAWVEASDNPTFLKDGSFLWMSERTGWKHIYHYAADGKLIKQLTNGDWEARTLNAVDASNGWIYFTGTKDSHIAEQVYRVKTDGTGLARLTTQDGTHTASFADNGAYFFDRWSDVNTPPQMRLYRGDGSLVRVLEENSAARNRLSEYKLGAVKFLQVPTRDGFPMEAMMITPPDFDPTKKYPVWSYTYSGPHAPSVRNAWGGTRYLWHQMLAQKGHIIWICDNRTASGKGAQSVWPAYKKLGPLELQDLLDGVGYLKQQPYVDGGRIGLWGWSYGGFMTSYALTHSDAFKIGIAGGSVTDWNLYDSIYTERYMQTPQKNPEGYQSTAPLGAAKNLKGKLLLIHGAMDDNVHFQNTVKFAYELQKAGLPFQLMAYPKSRHGITDPALVRHMQGMMTDFILANL